MPMHTTVGRHKTPEMQSQRGHKQLDQLHDVRNLWTGSLSTQMYDDKLAEMDNQSRNHLYWLARNKQLTAKTQAQTARAVSASEERPFSRCSWTNMSVMFNSPVDSGSRQADDMSSVTSTSSKMMNFCYLCSTMEEHQRNHLKLRLSSAVNRDGSLSERRQRMRYTPPAPSSRTRKKAEEPAAVVQEALYRVTVWTGDIPGGSTEANVYITMVGDQGVLLKTRLWRRQGTNKFSFMRGSKEVFHIKGPKLGILRTITIEHDGLEKRHGWYLERVEVQCMLTRRVWVFLCKNWLSLHHGDATIKHDLLAAVKERVMKEFEVTVETGKKRFAGTDANVYVTLHGMEGSTQRHQLNSQNPRGTCFQRGQTDRFTLQVPDIGELRSMRIEHDGEGAASSWYLNKVTLRDKHQPQCVYYFLYNGWLAKDMGDGRLWRELRALKQMPNHVNSGKPVQYEVIVKTGDIRGAGTTANVYIAISGTTGKTSKMFLSDSSNNFERSKTESFKLKAVNVGKVKSIRIGVDASGPDAGWFCDHIKVRKSLSREEIHEKLTQLKQAWKEAMQQTSDRVSNQEKENIDTTNEQRNEGDTETLPVTSSPKILQKDAAEKRGAEYARAFDENGRVRRIPVGEEYVFPCSKWFASDQDDGLFERELLAERQTMCYQSR